LQGAIPPATKNLLLFALSFFDDNEYCLRAHSNVAMAFDNELTPNQMVTLLESITSEASCELPKKVKDLVTTIVMHVFSSKEIDIANALTALEYSDDLIDELLATTAWGLQSNIIAKSFDCPIDYDSPFDDALKERMKKIKDHFK
jgi:hypothetical protein